MEDTGWIEKLSKAWLTVRAATLALPSRTQTVASNQFPVVSTECLSSN